MKIFSLRHYIHCFVLLNLKMIFTPFDQWQDLSNNLCALGEDIDIRPLPQLILTFSIMELSVITLINHQSSLPFVNFQTCNVDRWNLQS